MICLSNDKLAKIVEERNSTSRYLDSLNINDSYFEGILSRIYLQVRKLMHPIPILGSTLIYFKRICFIQNLYIKKKKKKKNGMILILTQ